MEESALREVPTEMLSAEFSAGRRRLVWERGPRCSCTGA